MDGLSTQNLHRLRGARPRCWVKPQPLPRRVVVVLWSAVSQASQWVRDEASQARDEKKLIPVRIDGARPPLGFHAWTSKCIETPDHRQLW